jgi:hypothetical protein
MPFPVHVHQPWVGAPPPGVCLSPAAFETLPLAPLGWPARPAGLRGYARVVQHFTRRTLCFTYRRAAACASSLPVSALHRPPAGCDHCECAPHQRAGRVSLASAPPAAHICRCQRTCCRPPAAAGGGAGCICGLLACGPGAAAGSTRQRWALPDLRTIHLGLRLASPHAHQVTEDHLWL